ncbi:hypothetical protein BH10ACT8_BH10ACT8_22550 [soil metagenome]
MSVPSVFGLPHLSEDAVAAFADGVLGTAASARAARHCVECRECADAVRGQRETAMMLRSAAAPCLPTGLMDRLAGLPMSTSLPPTRGLPTALGADGIPVFVAFDPRHSDSATERAVDDRPDAGSASFTIPPPIPAASLPPVDPPTVTAAHTHTLFGLRRGVLPIGLIASAAAVVLVGTLGGQMQSASGDAGHNAPAAGLVGATQSPSGQRAPTSPAPASSFATQNVLSVPVGPQPSASPAP